MKTHKTYNLIDLFAGCGGLYARKAINQCVIGTHAHVSVLVSMLPYVFLSFQSLERNGVG